jgi:diguanylate cyclase (GGDEF)-like protein
MSKAALEDTDTSAVPPPPADASNSAPYLIVLAGSQVGEMHKLERQRTVVGRGETADLRIPDDGMSREHAEILLDGVRVTVRDLGSTNGTYCNGVSVQATEVADGDKIVLGSTTILKFSHGDGIEASYQRDRHRGAGHDTSTRALRREFFIDRLESEVAFALRHATPLAIVMWDLDNLAAVNDQYGRAAGDRVLSSTAHAVSAAIRREDIFARYGGEEFAIACRATNMARAFRLAERLRESICETVVSVGDDRLRVSASFGVAICPNHGVSGAADLIAAADAAVARAKTNGRNRTEIAA